MTKEPESLEQVVAGVVERHLKPAQVLSVNVEPGEDHDGDPIIRISVIFKVEGDRLDPRRVKSLARHLREPLSAIREERFPIFSFRSSAEAGAEAA